MAQFYHVSLDDLVGSEVEFVSQPQKLNSRILQSMIGKICELELNLSSMNYDYLDKSVKLVDVNENWLKETVKRYIDVDVVLGICFKQEDK